MQTLAINAGVSPKSIYIKVHMDVKEYVFDGW